jgi:hypothetical protein
MCTAEAPWYAFVIASTTVFAVKATAAADVDGALVGAAAGVDVELPQAAQATRASATGNTALRLK